MYVGNDPLEAAANVTFEPRTYYGQALVAGGFVNMERGQPKTMFDPQFHKMENRRTEIKIDLVPLPEMNLKFSLSREYIAESKDWAGIVLPSLKKVGLPGPKELNGRWCAMKAVPTGRSYQDKNTGEQKEATVLVVTALFTDEAACRQAYLATNPTQGMSAPAPTAATPTNGNGNGNPERMTAAKFLPALWKSSNGDLDMFAQKIANMPILAKHFTVESPEVQAVVLGG